VREDARVAEEGDRGDLLAVECEHEESERPRDRGMAVVEVAAEGGSAVGAGRYDPQRCAAQARPVVEKDGDGLFALVLERVRRHGHPGVVGEQGDEKCGGIGDCAGSRRVLDSAEVVHTLRCGGPLAANLCSRRRRLYEKQLGETKKYLGELVHQNPFTSTDAGRLASALADSELVDALEEILNIYVVYGVARDLQRLRTSKVLFRRDTTSLPFVDEVLPSDGSPPSYTGAGQTADPDVTPAQAYGRYFSWYIDPDEVAHQENKSKSGVEAFYERYPLLAHAVQTVTNHHEANIKLACQRIAGDWNEIQAAFFAGRTMEQLTKIRTTGNDFHKGGKQVLILTFLLDDGSRGRVVYKPSGVEIDCRIVGDSDIVNGIAPQGYRQDASLTELINELNPPGPRPEGFTTRSLPTYRILPYNRDSVPDSYGYLEFLTHEPELHVQIARKEEIPEKVGAEAMTVRPADVKRSDWIVDDPKDGRVFYHQLGALMAMAMAVSLSDLHVQNVIAHDRRPHLIDLEEALKRPMKNVKDTYLHGVLDRYDDPEGNVLTIVEDGTSKLGVGWSPGIGKPAASALYLSHGGSAPAERVPFAGPAGSDGERNRRALVRGFVDVVEALATPAGSEAVEAWARGLDRTIARFVTLATAEYAHSCRDLYMTYCENSVESLAQDVGYKNFRYRTPEGKDVFFFARAVSARRDLWRQRLRKAAADDASEDDAREWHAPFFAVEHPTHAWRDYLNCDVPSFYHLLGSPDLLNTKGDTLDVVAAVDWQNGNVDVPGDLPEDWEPNDRGEYLPERPIDMVVAQLQRLRDACATREGKRAFLAEALKGLGGLDSDVSALARRVVGADELRLIGAGRRS
jgi:hypothetical protein